MWKLWRITWKVLTLSTHFVPLHIKGWAWFGAISAFCNATVKCCWITKLGFFFTLIGGIWLASFHPPEILTRTRNESNSRNDKVYVWRHLRKVFSCFCVNARNNVWAYEAQIFSHARLVLVFHWILNDNEIQLLRVNFPRTSDGRGIKCFREYGIRIKCRSTSFRKPHYNFNHFSFDPPHRTHQLIWSQISKMASKSQKSILVHGNSVIRVTTQNSM